MSVVDDFTLTELLNEEEWRRCFPDWNTTTNEEKADAFTHFCRNHWLVIHPERGRIPFELSDSQRDALDCILEERYSLFLKARQIGFSTLVSTYVFWLTYGYPDRSIVLLSIGQREAIELLAHAKRGYRSLPQWMKHHGPVVTMTQERITFGNGSEIASLPSGIDPARGKTVFLVVLDEMASLKNPEDAWASVEPVADIGGRVIALSTAKGEGNIFHRLWVGSRGGGNGTNRFRGMFFPWWAAAALDRDDEWYEAKAADTADWLMAQEYPDNPEDAFLRSGRPVFNLQIIRRWEPVAPLGKGYLRRTGRDIEFVDDGGALSIWEWPQEKTKYAIGADVAEGLEHGDYSSAHVLNATTRQPVAHFHAHVDSDVFGDDVLNLLGLFYNKALIGVERNMGAATIKALQRVKYPVLYRQRQQQLRAPNPTETMGWYTTPQTKRLLTDELQKEMRGPKDESGEWTFGLICPDVETTQELKTFVREGNGKMHGSPHDDRVMSLAIAVQMLKHVNSVEYRVKEEPGPGTCGYFERVIMGWGRRDKPRIGAHAFRKRA